MSAFDLCDSCGHSEFLHWVRGCQRYAVKDEYGQRGTCGCPKFKPVPDSVGKNIDLDKLRSDTGFWIFPFHKTPDGRFEKLADAEPGVLDGVRDRVLRLTALFYVEPGVYDVWVGVGPNPLEVQQTASSGRFTIKPGERLRATAKIDIALPHNEVVV